MYMACWKKGLKTTYYLRGQGATRIEKSTTSAVGDTSKQGGARRATPAGATSVAPATTMTNGTGDPIDKPVGVTINDPSIDKMLDGKALPDNACSIDNPDCEACQ